MSGSNAGSIFVRTLMATAMAMRRRRYPCTMYAARSTQHLSVVFFSFSPSLAMIRQIRVPKSINRGFPASIIASGQKICMGPSGYCWGKISGSGRSAHLTIQRGGLHGKARCAGCGRTVQRIPASPKNQGARPGGVTAGTDIFMHTSSSTIKVLSYSPPNVYFISFFHAALMH